MLAARRRIAGLLLQGKTAEDASENVGKLFQLFNPLLASCIQRLRQSSNCLGRMLAGQLSPRADEVLPITPIFRG